MMNRCLWIASLMVLFLLGYGGSASGQIVQYGRVVETNSGGKTLSGVSIEVPSEHDCTPTSSDAHGVFRLCFKEHQTGDKVHVSVRKKGYEVVNVHIIKDGWTLTDRDTLLIEMAPTKKVNEARRHYYDLVEAACVERYNTTVSFLDEQYASHTITLPEYQYWKMEAENELHQAYQDMDAYADAFARINEDNTDAATREIVSKLKSNDMVGAMALLSDEPYESVLQAYATFTVAFPMVVPEVSVSQADIVTPQESDSLYASIMALQTFAKFYEDDLATSGVKYARSCAYLGVLYKERGWNEASGIYLSKALKMFEMLDLIEGVDTGDYIEKLRRLLENQ